MALYDPVNGVYRKVSKKYDPVDGVYRKVKAAYYPVDGVYRKYFSSGKTIPAGFYWATEDFRPDDLAEPQDIRFTSNGWNFYAMFMDYDDWCFRYSDVKGVYSDDGISVFSTDDRGDWYGWQDEAYAGIEITSDQVVSEDFYNWFMANWFKLW